MTKVDYRVEAVPDEASDAPVPDLVARLRAVGFVGLGRLSITAADEQPILVHYEGRDREILIRHLHRAPRHVLALPDGSTTAVVDADRQRPVIRFATVLDSGALVETVATPPHEVPMPRTLPPTARHAIYTRSVADQRHVAVVDLQDAADAGAAHRATVERYSTLHGGTPLPIQSMPSVVSLWRRALEHDTRVVHRLKTLGKAAKLVWIPLYVFVLLPLWYLSWALLGDPSDTNSQVFAVAMAIVVGLGFSKLSGRLTSWLLRWISRQIWLRPAYR